MTARKVSEVRKRFAHRLRAIRIPRGYKTARSFAEALKIDENRYTRYERAEVEPDLDLLMRICDLLKATPNDLLCDRLGLALEESIYGLTSSVGNSSVLEAQPNPDEMRKAIGWQLAELIATVRLQQSGRATNGSLNSVGKLRETAPIFARIEADPFEFMQEIVDYVGEFQLDAQTEARLERLTSELMGAIRHRRPPVAVAHEVQRANG